MTEDFILVCSVLHDQIACIDFDGHWDYVPFMELNDTGYHVGPTLCLLIGLPSKLFVFSIFIFIFTSLIESTAQDFQGSENTWGYVCQQSSGSDKTVASV